MSEFLDSFFEHFKSRFSNVLIAAFCISWIICNWAVVLVIFSDLKVQEKIFFIRSYSDNPGIWRLLWIPLISILVFPWFAAVLRIYNTWSQGKSRRALYKAASVDVVPSEKVNELLDEKQKSIFEGLQKINELYTDIRVERERAINAESLVASFKDAEIDTKEKIKSLERMIRELNVSQEEHLREIHSLNLDVTNMSSQLKEEADRRERIEYERVQLSKTMSRLVNDSAMMQELTNRYGPNFTRELIRWFS